MTAGGTQRQLAAATGLAVGTIAAIAQGQRRVTVGEAMAIAQAVGTTVERMVAGAPTEAVKAPIGRPPRRA